jgi:predicted transcriptional regulator
MYRLEDHDLVRSEKTGRKTMYELTRKGEELAKDFVELFRTMGASVPPSAPKLG